MIERETLYAAFAPLVHQYALCVTGGPVPDESDFVNAALAVITPALVEARAAERERCAKVAERRRSGRQPEPHEIADEIRALSDETPSAGGFPEEERLLKLMRDPRYWKDRDPEITRAVTEGFRALYPSAGRTLMRSDHESNEGAKAAYATRNAQAEEGGSRLPCSLPEWDDLDESVRQDWRGIVAAALKAADAAQLRS